MKDNKLREEMLNHPVYWVESFNGYLYNAIITFKEKHNMKQKDLAAHLGISAGRVSQILNDGEINFSIEKLIEIALKVDVYPVFRFEEKHVFLEKERLKEKKHIKLHFDRAQLFDLIPDFMEKRRVSKTISISQNMGKNRSVLEYALEN